MLKYIIITVILIIVLSVLFYPTIINSPSGSSESLSGINRDQGISISYIITSEVHGGISMMTIDSLSACANYQFTKRNLSSSFLKELSRAESIKQ